MSVRAMLANKNPDCACHAMSHCTVCDRVLWKSSLMFWTGPAAQVLCCTHSEAGSEQLD